MEDSRFSTELIRRAQAGVRVRVIADTRAPNEANTTILQQLADAGIPLRRRTATGILHWKAMVFAAQQVVQFSGANYSADAFVYVEPYKNYVDEAIFFTDDQAIVQSFMRRYDDLWTDTTKYANHANVTTLARTYPLYSIDPSLNFAPDQSYRTRAVSAYGAENTGIDVAMYRITDRAHADAMIQAVQRGVRVRLLAEPLQYRDVTRPWHSWNVDRMYMAGVQVRHRAHLGLNHQKSVLLHGQGLTIFGSSNWTSPSSDQQEEHNLFTTKGWFFDWFRQQFERKWNNLAPAVESEPFHPLPPDATVQMEPADGATRVGTNVSLVFEAGPFAHTYDIYFGTSPHPPLLAADVPLGPTEPGAPPRRYQLPTLQPDTAYYWRIVSKTAALQATRGQVWAFSTGAVPAPPPSGGTGEHTRSDFDGDGRADLLWQHDTDGYLATWKMNGTSLVSSDLLSPGRVADANWKIVGTGDFDGDGRPDIVWQEQTQGWIGIWLMNGRTLTSSTTLSPASYERVADTNWKIAGVMDVNGDGRSDILWRERTQGWLVAWLCSGTTVTASISLSPERLADPNWQIVGSGDMNADGRTDIIWQNVSTGYIAAWLMNGTRLIDSVLLSPNRVTDSNWRIAGVGDYNGDGRADLVWQERTQGWLAIWLMNGTDLMSSIAVTPERVANVNWRIVGPK